MYNLIQLSYFLETSPYLKVFIPSQVCDVESFNEMLKIGMKEVFIVIPNLDGLVIHLENVQFNKNVRTIDDVFSVCDPSSFLVFTENEIYLECNGTQILDNSGILLFKKDVERHLAINHKTLINEMVHETILEKALHLKFFKGNDVQHRVPQSETSKCSNCIERLAGMNKSFKKRRNNLRSTPLLRAYG